MFLHALEMSRLGLKKLLSSDCTCWCCCNCTVCILGFGLRTLDWIGRGKDRKWLAVHAYIKVFGEEICSTVLFWYAFTGCSFVSKLLGKGKKTAWKTWGRFPKATETFIRLLYVSKSPESDLKIIENFVVLMYASCPHTWLPEVLVLQVESQYWPIPSNKGSSRAAYP